MTVKEQIVEVAFCSFDRDAALVRVGNLLAEQHSTANLPRAA